MEKLSIIKQKLEQKENVNTKLYHVSSFDGLKTVKIGDTFSLFPGPQGAEGKGVYFSQDKPRPSAAEGASKNGITGVVVIEASSKSGWWKSKGFVVKKFGRPPTWHSDGKSIKLIVREIHKKIEDPFPFIVCDWEFIN